MITQPSDVRQKDNWDGWSVDKATGYNNRNLESGMSFAEHQRIVLQANGLLVSLDASDEEQEANRAVRSLMRLKGLYNGSEDGILYISKGIHQSYDKPHLQLLAEIDDEVSVYHLDVSAYQDVVKDHGGDEHFHWRPVRFAATVRTGEKDQYGNPEYDFYAWPEHAAIQKKKQRDRRGSISLNGLVALNAEIDKEAAKRKAQGDEQKARNAIIERIKGLGLTLKRGQQLAKFWEGKPTIFLTSGKKPTEMSCTFDGTFLIRPNGQKNKVVA